MAAANLTCPVPILHTRWNLPVRSAGHLNLNRCGSRLMLAMVIVLTWHGSARRSAPGGREPPDRQGKAETEPVAGIQ